jgi:hypothetical protein
LFFNKLSPVDNPIEIPGPGFDLRRSARGDVRDDVDVLGGLLRPFELVDKPSESAIRVFLFDEQETEEIIGLAE